MRVLRLAALIGLFTASLAAAQDRETGRFQLDVKKSGFLKPGVSRIETTSAVATYTAEFVRGRVKSLKVQVFGPPLTAEQKARLATNDNAVPENARRPGRVVLVLQVDDQRRITQANLTIVLVGQTVAQTIAWQPDSVAKYFGDAHYANGRLHLKSKGSYTKAEPDEVLTMTWDFDLDVPVIDQIGKP